ncbi:MAG: AraC family transcriptional regulator [Bacteroidetes bacterium]|nr:AraC family transcriptional regulator [Bacteroidota bacterium]
MTFYIRGYEKTKYLVNGLELIKPRSVISGQFTGRVDRYISYPEILMIIVDFKPGGLHRLIKIPFIEFADKDLDAETVFPSTLKLVNERLSSAESYSEMMAIIETFFIELMQQSGNEYSIIDHILTEVVKDPDTSIKWLASNSYLSTKQLIRKFHEKIGISPKTFLRIARFNQTYWMHLKNPGLSWFQIAMACGYTDYQHLAKEYKQFANNTPNNFFLEESKAPGRMLGLNK